MIKDPTYPRILLIPIDGEWLSEVQYSMEMSISKGPFKSAHDATFDALLRISKETTRDKESNNRRPGEEEPGC